MAVEYTDYTTAQINALRSWVEDRTEDYKFVFDVYTVYKETDADKVYALIHTDAWFLNDETVEEMNGLLMQEAKTLHELLSTDQPPIPIDYFYIMGYYRHKEVAALGCAFQTDEL